MKNLKHGNEFVNDKRLFNFSKIFFIISIIAFMFFGLKILLKIEHPVGEIAKREFLR